MRETSDYGVKPTRIELPPAVVDRFLDTRRELVYRSAIVWGEHCTECAWPACYSTCSLYTPRADHQCRRFVNGIERVESSAAPTLELQRIGFRKWAKLEGRGPATLLSPPGRLALRRLDCLADAVFGLPMPRRVKIGLARRWNAAKSWLAGRGIKLPSNSCFMLEAWNPAAASYAFTLSIVPASVGGHGMFQTGFAIEPGYNCIRVPTSSLRARVDIDSDYLFQFNQWARVGPVRSFSASSTLSSCAIRQLCNGPSDGSLALTCRRRLLRHQSPSRPCMARRRSSA